MDHLIFKALSDDHFVLQMCEHVRFKVLPERLHFCYIMHHHIGM
jgi:hypothetical protein